MGRGPAVVAVRAELARVSELVSGQALELEPASGPAPGPVLEPAPGLALAPESVRVTDRVSVRVSERATESGMEPAGEEAGLRVTPGRL
jgi:hypothetical protein